MANEDPDRLRWIRSRLCLLAPFGGCGGRTEAHHAGAAGMGQRSHDDTAIPLCSSHHRQWHSANGFFKDFAKADRRAWAEAAIARTRTAYEQSRLDLDVPF
jgi:hypothetical protein